MIIYSNTLFLILSNVTRHINISMTSHLHVLGKFDLLDFGHFGIIHLLAVIAVIFSGSKFSNRTKDGTRTSIS